MKSFIAIKSDGYLGNCLFRKDGIECVTGIFQDLGDSHYKIMYHGQWICLMYYKKEDAIKERNKFLELIENDNSR